MIVVTPFPKSKSIVLNQCTKQSCHCGNCMLCKDWSHRPVHATSNGSNTQICTNSLSLLFKLCEGWLHLKSWNLPSNTAIYCENGTCIPHIHLPQKSGG